MTAAVAARQAWRHRKRCEPPEKDLQDPYAIDSIEEKLARIRSPVKDEREVSITKPLELRDGVDTMVVEEHQQLAEFPLIKMKPLGSDSVGEDPYSIEAIEARLSRLKSPTKGEMVLFEAAPSCVPCFGGSAANLDAPARPKPGLLQLGGPSCCPGSSFDSPSASSKPESTGNFGLDLRNSLIPGAAGRHGQHAVRGIHHRRVVIRNEEPAEELVQLVEERLHLPGAGETAPGSGQGRVRQGMPRAHEAVHLLGYAELSAWGLPSRNGDR